MGPVHTGLSPVRDPSLGPQPGSAQHGRSQCLLKSRSCSSLTINISLQDRPHRRSGVAPVHTSMGLGSAAGGHSWDWMYTHLGLHDRQRSLRAGAIAGTGGNNACARGDVVTPDPTNHWSRSAGGCCRCSCVHTAPPVSASPTLKRSPTERPHGTNNPPSSVVSLQHL
jgi:hypothetical protein